MTETLDQKKARRNEASRVRVLAYRKTQAFKDWYVANRESRLKRREKYRRAAGIQPKGDKRKREQREAEKRRALKKAMEDYWCEAHVIRYLSVLKARAKSAKRYISNPEKERARSRRAKAELRPAYIRQQLFSMGFEAHQITPEIIELKREQLSLRRLSRETEKAASEQMKEANETIAKHT
jgi:hypothetical protein